MKFSVVVPLYNKAPHVEATIRSALAQTLPPHEIIIVDDGSTDGGLAIAQAIDDPRIRFFTRSPPGPGGYAARNMGVMEAGGDWIAFLDADDYWTPDHLATLAAAIEHCGGAVGCAFSRLVSVTGDVHREYPVSERYLAADVPLDFATMLCAWLDKSRCPMWTGAVAFRRDVLIEAGLFPDGRARRGGDKDLWLRCIARARTVFSPKVTAHFHQDSVNRVSNSTAHATLPIITQTIAALLPQVNPAERKLLRALSNQEIGLYAKYAVGARARLGWAFLSNIYLPDGGRTLARVVAMMAAGVALRLVDPRRRLG